MKLKDLVLILGLLAVFTLAGCIGEKAESANIQTVRLYGLTEDKDYELTVTLPDGFYIESGKTTTSNAITVSGVKILNKNITGSMGIMLLSMSEPKRSIFMLDDLSAFVKTVLNDVDATYRDSVDVKIFGRDGRVWHYWIRVSPAAARQGARFVGVPMDDTAAILISSLYPTNITDEFLNNMQITPVKLNK